MKGFLFRPKHLAIMICWLALAGCLGGPSAPTNFYMLSPLSSSPTGTSAATAEGSHPYRPRNGCGSRIFESQRDRRQPG